ncbi:MAG: sialidase family protein [Thermoanaerobaculia bacterium]
MRLLSACSRNIVAICLAVGMLALAGPGWALSPTAGSVSQASPQTAWSGGPNLLAAGTACGGPANSKCDNYKLTINPPSGNFQVEVTLTPQLADDYDLEVYAPNGTLAGTSGNGVGAVEKVVLNNPAGGVYTVSAAPYVAIRAYSAGAKLTLQTTPSPSTATPPTYGVYAPPAGVGLSAGEPTLGVNYRTGRVMFIAGTETLKVTFNDAVTPATAAWQNVSAPQTSLITFDPILYTDPVLGRTFVSQLLPTKISLMAWTDDDGATWNPSMGAGINSGVDHQTVGGGTFARGLLTPLTSYSHAVYYCSQDIALAQCAVSLDGGTTFGLAVPIYNLTQCAGLHGHVKVAPDGTAYVPNKNCNGQQGVAVSTDNGLTWTVRTVPGSSAGSSDPSVGIGSDGTVYFGWSNGDGHAYTAVSHDQGATWSNIQDVGAGQGIQNIAFPAVVAGDGDRAAFAYLGTAAGGAATEDDPNFPAVWHLYVAHTYDGGASWVTTDVTPNDPVQRGTICTAGTTCGTTRNLLDFMDVQVDAEGRVLVGYADGCVGACVTGGANTFAAEARIARQKSGKRLYAAFD